MRVALFVTCLVDGLFPDVGKATVGLLERLGCAVEVPLAQTCCGQMHINTGYLPEAVPLVRRHVAAFEGYELGALADGTRIPGFYQRLGWEAWQGPTWAAGPDGPVRTAEEDGSVLVLRTPATGTLDLTGPLTCDWRPGDVW